MIVVGTGTVTAVPLAALLSRGLVLPLLLYLVVVPRFLLFRYSLWPIATYKSSRWDRTYLYSYSLGNSNGGPGLAIAGGGGSS